MRKNMVAVLFTAFVFSATAQTTTPIPTARPNPGGIYIKGGLNLANITTSADGRVDEAKMLTSFHIGIINDMPVGDAFSFQAGLMVTGKGSKTEINTTSVNYKLTSNPLYLELPVNFVFKIPFGNGNRLFLGAGPYIAMGIGGKTKGEYQSLSGTSSYEKDIEFNNDDPFTTGQEDASVNKLRRFDYGANALAGFETGKFMIGVNYGYGLAKIASTQANDDDQNKHRVWSISLGIQL